jgi:hypothetical protein
VRWVIFQLTDLVDEETHIEIDLVEDTIWLEDNVHVVETCDLELLLSPDVLPAVCLYAHSYGP